MTPILKESLLLEAKQRYPIGSVFLIAHKPDVRRTVKSHDKHDYLFLISDSDGIFHLNLIIEEGGDCRSASVYTSKHGWAETVYKPQIKTIKFF